VTVYSEVEADPPEARVLATVAAARAATAEVVVGLGGGSSLDTAKLVALLASTPSHWSIYGIGLAKAHACH
jgi:alcohol dehydrogenase class IV